MTDPIKRKRIFVVDDEALISKTLGLILQRSGYDATAFTNPLRALEAGRLESLDLLISDVMMPELSGIDLAARILQIWPNCKILLFSGQAKTQALMETAWEHGRCFQILTKPVHPADLLKRVHEDLLSPSLL